MSREVRKIKIYEFRKNALEIVRTELSDFYGEKYLNVRVWFDAAGRGNKEDLKPSPKGITLSIDKIGELKKGIDKAYAQLEQEKRRHHKEGKKERQKRSKF